MCDDFSATAVMGGRTSHSLDTTQGILEIATVELFRHDDGWK
jgi:hypothetical protein